MLLLDNNLHVKRMTLELSENALILSKSNVCNFFMYIIICIINSQSPSFPYCSTRSILERTLT